MTGRDGRMLFCAMSSIHRYAATPVATITEFADDPGNAGIIVGRAVIHR
jgi:hypothetical protein